MPCPRPSTPRVGTMAQAWSGSVSVLVAPDFSSYPLSILCPTLACSKPRPFLCCSPHWALVMQFPFPAPQVYGRQESLPVASCRCLIPLWVPLSHILDLSFVYIHNPDGTYCLFPTEMAWSRPHPSSQILDALGQVTYTSFYHPLRKQGLCCCPFHAARREKSDHG